MVAYVQSAALQSASTNAVAITLPGSPTVGNLLLAWVTCFQDFAAVNAGWVDTGITVTDANSGVMRLLRRYVQMGDTATYSLATSNNNFWNVSITEVSGVSGTWALDFDQSRTGSSTGNITTSTITTDADNAFALLGVQCAGVSTVTGTYSSPWVQTASQNAGYTCAGGYQQMGASGASVNCTVTWTHAFTATYIMVTINELIPPPTLAVVQSKSQQQSGASAVAVTLTSTPTVGNLMIAWVTCFSGFAAVNAGWTDSGLTVTDANSGVCKLLYRYVQSGDTTALALATSNTNFWCAHVVEVTGVSGVWAADLDQSNTASSTGNPNAATLTSTANNALYLFGLQCAQSSTTTSIIGSPWTQDSNVSGSGYSGAVGHISVPASGTATPTTITWTHSFTATGIQIILNETPAPPVASDYASSRFFFC